MDKTLNFTDYLAKVKKIIKDNKGKMNDIGRAIRWIDFNEYEVEPNMEYFKEQYELNIPPEQTVCNLRNNVDELYRKIDDFNDDVILHEVSSRNLERDVIRDAWTSDLEDELNDRSDSNFVNKYNLDEEELLDLLNIKVKTYNSKKEMIAEALDFNNYFSYTLEDVINKIKEIW